MEQEPANERVEGIASGLDACRHLLLCQPSCCTVPARQHNTHGSVQIFQVPKSKTREPPDLEDISLLIISGLQSGRTATARDHGEIV